MQRFTTLVFGIFAYSLLAFAQAHAADIYIKTSIRNAQTQIDRTHTTKVDLNSRTVGNQIKGAILTMKRARHPMIL